MSKGRFDRRLVRDTDMPGIAGVIKTTKIHIWKFQTVQSFLDPDRTSGDRSALKIISRFCIEGSIASIPVILALKRAVFEKNRPQKTLRHPDIEIRKLSSDIVLLTSQKADY